MFTIKKIKNKSEITSCSKFEISNYQWTNLRKPNTYGWVGLLEEGLYVKFIIEESNPLRNCDTYQELVCFDSAVEAFFAFLDSEEELTDESMYLNFEINANNWLYAKSGKGRKNRKFISDELYAKCECKTEINESDWSAEFIIPAEYLKTVCDWQSYVDGREFYCNFYKIAENKEIEHYGSFHKIDSEIPNFHKPTSFERVKIVE